MRYAFIAYDEEGTVAISDGPNDSLKAVLAAFAEFLRNTDFEYVEEIAAITTNGMVHFSED